MQSAAARADRRRTRDVAIVDALPSLLVGVDWRNVLDAGTRARARASGARAVPAAAAMVRVESARDPPGAVHRLGARFSDGTDPSFLTIVTLEYDDGWRETLSAAAGAPVRRGRRRASLKRAPGAVLARITGARKGAIVDGMHDDGVCDRLLGMIAAKEDTPTRRGSAQGLRHQPRRSWRTVRKPHDAPVAERQRRAEQQRRICRRPAGPQAVPPNRADAKPRLRDRPVPDRTQVHAHAGARWRAPVPAHRARARHARHRADSRQASGIRLGLHDRRFAPVLRARRRAIEVVAARRRDNGRDAREGLDDAGRTAAVLHQPRTLVSADRDDAGTPDRRSFTSRSPAPSIRRSRQNRWIAPRSIPWPTRCCMHVKAGFDLLAQRIVDAGRGVPDARGRDSQPPRRPPRHASAACARSTPPAGASGFTATTISVRFCGRRRTSSFSISRASRRVRSRNGGSSSRR